jgi:hypothetical protein
MSCRCFVGSRVRPKLTRPDRVFLTVASRMLPCSRWHSFLVTPTTLLRWHRHMVARRWTYRGRTGPATDRKGDPRARASARARESELGYQRIVGEINGLGLTVSATTLKKIMRWAGLARPALDQGPPGEPSSRTGKEHARGRLLHRRKDHPATPVRALLHRAQKPTRPPGRLHRQPNRTLRHPTGAPVRLDGSRSGNHRFAS